MIAEQQLVFNAVNQHAAECGAAPNVSNEAPDKYYGYFENEHGEQWVLVYDRKARRGSLRGGDAGWENEHAIEGREVRLTLNASETAWLHACLIAAGA